jgi:hypothetical protein
VREIPDAAVNLSAPAGTPAASAAEFAPIWCAHGVKHEWVADQGGYLPMVLEVDEIHSDIPIVSPGALPVLCQPSTAFDPDEYPLIGPRAVERALAKVLREHPELR